MSLDNLKKFIQLVKTDQQVAKKAAAIGYQNIPGLIAYGKEMNLDFKEIDLKEIDFEAFQKEMRVGTREITDADLEGVSGGTPGWYSPSK